jgi:hypothetical protein
MWSSNSSRSSPKPCASVRSSSAVEGLAVGDGLVAEALEVAAVEDAIAPRRVFPGHQHLADGRAVQRRAPADARVHAQHVRESTLCT